MQAEFAALQAQVATLNSQLADMISTQKSVDPSGFRRLTKAAEINSRVFRDAAASTGLFETQQVRVNSATDEYVKKLNAQKMGFREMAKQRKVATAAYREQLAMERMLVRQNPASSMRGKQTYDVVWPKEYEKSLDTAGRRLSWFNSQLKSGATQMVNWGKNTQWAGRQLMVGFTMPIMAVGAAAGVMAYQVDKEFTRIAKVYDTQANRATDLAGWEAETAKLRKDGYDTARMAAEQYQAAITDTLNVQAELAATGIKGYELQKQTAEIMRISTLGELDNNTATEAAIALQQIWGMNSNELADTFNYLNATENATSLATEDFAVAIPVASAAVKAFGGDVKELGILMTAMKERGINASEGANALKATMQRLSRPSKQVQEEFKQLTGKSIVELVDSSNGLIDIFTKLNDITKNMGANEKRDVFAGLFGSYQVARMTALTEGMGALQEGTGQVAEAARVAGMSTEQWAATAQTEIDALNESVSGRFKSALEQVKISMAEMGLPFLKAGTKILEVLGKIVNYINDLPDFAKTMLGWGVAIAAIAGPAVMLTGLFGNLFGNGIKGVAGLITMFGKLTGGMNIATQESRIYAAAAKMSENAHLTNTKAVTNLTGTMDKLVLAMKASITASEKEAAAMGTSIKMSAARKKVEDERIRQMQIENRLLQEHALLTKNDRIQYWGTGKDGKRRQVGQAEARRQATAYIDTRNQAHQYAAEQQVAMASAASAKASKEEAAARAKTKVLASGAALSTAAMAGSMATMMFTSNETANNIAQWGMVLSFAAPAVAGLAKGMGVAAVAAGKWAMNVKAGSVAAMFSRASVAGMGSALVGMVGVTGLIGGALLGAGVAAFAIWKHFNNIKKEQERIDRNNAALTTQTERWAAATGKTLDNYRKLRVAQQAGANSDSMQKRVDFYRSDEEKDATGAYQDMSGIEQNLTLVGKYIDLVEGAGMSQKEATKEVQAFLVATGQSYTQAAAGAQKVAESIGMIGGSASEWTSQFDSALKTIYAEGYLGNEKNSKALGQQAGLYYSQAFINGTESQKQAIWTQLKSQVMDPWNSIIEDMKAQNALLDETALQQNVDTITGSLGITAKEWEDATSSGEKFRSFYMSLDSDMRDNLKGLLPFDEAIQEAEGLERAIVKGIADKLGVASEGVDTLGELFNDAAVKAQNLWSKFGGASKQAIAAASTDVNALYKDLTGVNFNPADQGAFNELQDRLTNTPQSEIDKMDDSTRKEFERQQEALNKLLPALAAYNQMLNIQGADTDFGMLINLFGGFQNEVEEGTQKVKGLKSELDSLHDVKLTLEVVTNMYQDVRSGIQQDMADMMTSDFDNKMNASLAATDAKWENAQAGLDAKWEKRKNGAEKYWDARLEAVDRAIKAEEKAEDERQKMFEAEMDRMEKLNDARNKNIDFNIALNEGKLDEAAKIANDIQAGESQDLFQKAADASAEKSDKRVGRLEDRKDEIQKQADAAKAAMDATEKAQKAHLDKMAENAKAAAKAEWDQKKKDFDAQMELFLAFTARNDKELKAHMEAVGISYDDFGEILKNKGTNWSQFMGKEMKDKVRLAALELRNDEAWSQLGEGAIDGMIKAMGFPSKAAFQHFIKTGEFDASLTDKPANNNQDSNSQRHPNKEINGSHSGGWAGKTGNNRSGIARGTKGLHPSELMIRAQKGEFVVNAKDAADNASLLEAVNSGKMKGKPVGGAGALFPAAGLMAGAVMRSALFGLGKNIKEKVKGAKKAAKQMGAGGGDSLGSYTPGKGGWQKPSVPGYGWTNSHDYGAPRGTPVYALSDATVLQSRAITSGGSPGNGLYSTPYTSYGEYIQLLAADGNKISYGHMMPGSRRVSAGQKIPGGTQIGNVGNTGNAWGASGGYHLHMDVNGAEIAREYLASRGIPLRKGAADVRFDNTLANLHHGERVLTSDLTSKMDRAMTEYFANGGGNQYTIKVFPSEGMDEERLANLVVSKMNAQEARKPKSRTIGRGRRS